MSNHEVGRAAFGVIARTMLVLWVVAVAAPAEHAGADVVLATGDEMPGLGRIEVILGQMCVAPDGAVLTTVRAEDGRDALVCIDGSGPRVVVRSGDPEPTGRTFNGLQYGGGCSFTADRHLIFSGTTYDPQVDDAIVAAIYRAGPTGIVRLLGNGDLTDNGWTVELWSSVQYSANSAGDILTHVFAGGGSWAEHNKWGQHNYYLLTNSGLERAFLPFDPPWADDTGTLVRPRTLLSLTDRGAVLMLAGYGYPEPRKPNALAEWSNGNVRVIVRDTDLASDGLPYGALMNLSNHERFFMRGDTAVFGSAAPLANPRESQTRLFRYSPENPTPELVFTGGATGDPSFPSMRIVDSNAHGDVLFRSTTPETDSTFFVARAGQPLQSVPERDLGPCTSENCSGGLHPVALTDHGVVFSLVFPRWTPDDEYRVTLETDLGTVTGTSCSMLPSAPLDTPIATATPSGTAAATITTPTPEPSLSPEDTPPVAICAGDCGADGVVTVGDLVTIVNIALGSMTMSSCSACDQDDSGQATVDEVVMAVDAALSGCRAIRRR